MSIRRRAAIVVPIFLPALFLSGCGLLGFNTWHWNQKVIIVVETPTGERVGQSVQSVNWYESPAWARLGDSGGGFSNDLSGEAVVVELAPGKYIFALLKSFDGLASDQVFRPPISNSGNAASLRQEIRAQNDHLERLRETREVPRSAYPALVTFSDLSDPATAQKVDPVNLTASFGSGYRLVSIKLAITDEAKTEGTVQRVLGPRFFEEWARKRQAAFTSNGPFKKPPFAFQLFRNDFITGE
ncbi:hypothetical protein [Rhizobium laguerreae]|uniref:RzcB n=2 Tax=Rhizobium TaxID=379 RepID=Q9LAE7_RHILT|nr:hypothetical protein [Rhizobium laguerreae]AAF36414.1 RzcB [Rhizobium leguminosarum bv. trifolii]MBY3318520.1 hypothetical protein [Rhizobium laguerreae]MBY3358642.1 hypothetical protein [Rhizobium laguerreae]TCU18650.1 hypothetical protein EV131_114157 [Rhizobium laguerreae]